MLNSKPEESPPALITSETVAKKLSISVRTLWRLVAAGTFPKPVRYNRKLVRWKTKDVEAYLESLDVFVPYTPRKAS